MGNALDPISPVVDITEVFAALNAEREYQIRRWGIRQADGQVVEIPKPVADYVTYMRDYYLETQHRVSRDPGYASALESLVKVACLGIACMEHNGVDEHGRYYSREAVFKAISRSFVMVPHHLDPHFSHYLLKVREALDEATKYAACFNTCMALLPIREVVQLCVECLKMYGVKKRDLTTIINARDGLPA